MDLLYKKRTSMFSHKEKVEITAGEPQFTVRYVGKTETYTATGVGCTATPVQRIWDNSTDERRMRKCLLLVNPTGILLQVGKCTLDIYSDRHTER